MSDRASCSVAAGPSASRRHVVDRLALAALAAIVALVAGACDAGPPPPTPAITPGTGAAPRQVNVIMRDYVFEPVTVDLVPGETVRLNVVNAGLAVHELVLGPQTIQDAWAAAEKPAADPPPGPTPLVTVPAGLEGVRLVAQSGQTVSITYTVPDGGPPLILGCHIADHFERGMSGIVRFVGPGGASLAPARSPSSSPSPPDAGRGTSEPASSAVP